MTHRKKLMIVEDSMTQANAVAAHLSSEVDVIIASDGTQALRIVRIELPDLIILDVNLPKLNGIQVCQRLKRDLETAHVPVIMLTAATNAQQKEDGMNAGADHYIYKGEHATAQLLTIIRQYKLIDEFVS
jgi:two-component system, cell cycle response regulator